MKKQVSIFLFSLLLCFGCKDDFVSDDIANNEVYLNFDFNGESVSICQDAPWLFYQGPCEMEANFFAYHSQLDHTDPNPSVLVEKVHYKKTGYTQDRFPPEFRLFINAEGRSFNGKHTLSEGGTNYIEIEDENGAVYSSVQGEVKITHVSDKTFLESIGRDTDKEYRYVEGSFTASLRWDGTDYPINGQFLMSQYVGDK